MGELPLGARLANLEEACALAAWPSTAAEGGEEEEEEEARLRRVEVAQLGILEQRMAAHQERRLSSFRAQQDAGQGAAPAPALEGGRLADTARESVDTVVDAAAGAGAGPLPGERGREARLVSSLLFCRVQTSGLS